MVDGLTCSLEEIDISPEAADRDVLELSAFGPTHSATALAFITVWRELDDWRGSLLQRLEDLNDSAARHARSSLRFVTTLRALSTLADLQEHYRVADMRVPLQALKLEANTMYERFRTGTLMLNPLPAIRPAFVASWASARADLMRWFQAEATLTAVQAYRADTTIPKSMRSARLRDFGESIALALRAALRAATRPDVSEIIAGAFDEHSTSLVGTVIEGAELTNDAFGSSGFMAGLVEVLGTWDVVHSSNSGEAALAAERCSLFVARMLGWDATMAEGFRHHLQAGTAHGVAEAEELIASR